MNSEVATLKLELSSIKDTVTQVADAITAAIGIER